MWETIRYSLWALGQKKVVRWPMARVLHLQSQRLRKLLRHAAARSRFYGHKLHGLDVDHCRLEDIPVTTKSEMMASYDEVVTDPEVRLADLQRFVSDPGNISKKFLGRYAACHTSGSSGQPLFILQDMFVLELLFAFQMTRGNNKSDPLEAVKRWWEPKRLAVIALKEGFYPSASAWEHVPAAAKTYLDILRVAPTDLNLLEQLNAFRPNVLTAYASVLEALAAQADRLHLQAELQQIVSTSETLSERTRTQLGAAFGVPIIDNYSMGECAFLSNGCRTHRGVHVNADWAILEVVDEDYRPVAPGQAGNRVLLTNLANSVQPFIRYEILDRVTWAKELCACGNQLPRLESIGGRTTDFFWVKIKGEYKQLVGTMFSKAIDSMLDVRDWQAIQHERNHIEVLVELLPGRAWNETGLKDALDKQLASFGLRNGVKLDVKQAPRLTSDAKTGKVKRIISHVGPPATRS